MSVHFKWPIFYINQNYYKKKATNVQVQRYIEPISKDFQINVWFYTLRRTIINRYYSN